MNAYQKKFGFSQSVIALAVLAAFSPVRAQEGPDISQLTAPGSSVSLGVGLSTGNATDRARFGLYNGLRDNGTHGLLGFEYLNTDSASGRWTSIEGRNLGLDSREVRFRVQQLGDWSVSGEYSELVRHDPRTINTGLQGIGSTTPSVQVVAPGTGQDVNLELKRQGITLIGSKWFSSSLQFEATFKNEDKDGARIWARGYDCAAYVCTATQNATNTKWAMLMLPEPINSNIKQFDAKLTYAGDQLSLTGGYYGSFYTNANGSLNPTVPNTVIGPGGGLVTLNPAVAGGGTSLQNVLQSAMGLPPDNQSHQFYVQGNYRYSPTTNANFKFAHTHGTQNEDFAGMGLTGAPSGRSSLGGVVDTNLAQLGLTMRPVQKLTVLANLRYEDKQDKTPIAYYNVEGPAILGAPPPSAASPNLAQFTNGHVSDQRLAGKLETSYLFPQNYRGTLGVNFENQDRGAIVPTDSVAGLTAVRQKNDEQGWRAELRRSMSESFTGAVGYMHSKRSGSTWLRPYSINNGVAIGAGGSAAQIATSTNGLPNTGVQAVSDAQIFSFTGIFPFIMEDRQRDKVKLSGTWTPDDRLSMQFWYEDGKDSFSGPTMHGLRDTGMHTLSVDAAYVLSDQWKLTGYWSTGDQLLHVAQGAGGYDGGLRVINNTIGLGAVGKPYGRFGVGGNVTYTKDVSKYAMNADDGVSANNAAQLGIGLPDVVYHLIKLNLYGEYALEKNSYVRLDFLHQRSFLSDWQWGNPGGMPFNYSDGTTISAKQSQTVTFVAASYVYKFQ
jgi:MtrB/PioB family decaheme-associated outer membrane protein